MSEWRAKTAVLCCAVQAYHYLSSIAVKEGKVFALFVRSPSKVRDSIGITKECKKEPSAS